MKLLVIAAIISVWIRPSYGNPRLRHPGPVVVYPIDYSILIERSESIVIGTVTDRAYDGPSFLLQDAKGTWREIKKEKISVQVENSLKASPETHFRTLELFHWTDDPVSARALRRGGASYLRLGPRVEPDRRYLWFLVNIAGENWLMCDFCESWIEIYSGRHSDAAIRSYSGGITHKLVSVSLMPGDLEFDASSFTAIHGDYVVSPLQIAAATSLGLCEPEYSLVFNILRRMSSSSDEQVRIEACLVLATYDANVDPTICEDSTSSDAARAEVLVRVGKILKERASRSRGY